MQVMKQFRPDTDRLKPHNIELEQQILGAVLTDNEAYHRISGIVTKEHFFDQVHAEIWRRTAERIELDHIASPVTLRTDLELHEGLKQLGGPAYLARIAAGAISSFAVVDYATHLVELARRRTLLDGFKAVADGFQSGGMDADGAVASTELMLAEQEGSRAEPRAMSLLRAHTLAIAQANEQAQGNILAVPTGLAELDEAVVLRPKRYTVLAGATSMGKTASVVHIAKAAADAGFGVGFVSLEMAEEDLANRINSIDSRIPYKVMDRPMSEGTFRKMIETAKAQEALPIEIFSEKVRDVPSILSEGKRLQRKMQARGQFKGFKLLIIDYIQLMRGKGSNEFHALSKIANDLKQVAKMLDVHVIALAQLDRKLGEREDPRPRLSDLRGSGDLENAPDNVIFVYRPEYYLERQLLNCKDIEERADLEALMLQFKGKAEFIIAKARMGELGTVTVNCDLGTNRFWDVEAPQGGFEF